MIKMDCVFCRIVTGEAPMYKVYEDEKVLAFLDIRPISDGHTLIIPKIHAVMLENLPDYDLIALFKALKKLVKPIQIAMSSPASSISINNGREAGQIVPHVHIHVVPRQSLVGGEFFTNISRIKPRSREYFEEIAEKIQQAIENNII